VRGIRPIVVALASLLLAPPLATGAPHAEAGPIGVHVHQRWLDPSSPLGYSGVKALLAKAGAEIVAFGAPVGLGPVVSQQRVGGWLNATPEYRQVAEVNTLELAPDEQDEAGIRESFRAHNQILGQHDNVVLFVGINEPLTLGKGWDHPQQAIDRITLEVGLWHEVSTIPICHKFTNPDINEPGLDWDVMEDLWTHHQDAICYDWYYPSEDSIHTIDHLRALGTQLGKPVYLLEAGIPNHDRAFMTRISEGLDGTVIYHLAGEPGTNTERLASWLVQPDGSTTARASGHMLIDFEATPPSAPGWSTRTTWSTGASSPKVAFKAFNGPAPQWVDVDKNGKPEVLVTNTNRQFYLLDPFDGPILFQGLWPGPPAFQPTHALQPGIPVGDRDGDGRRELYVAGSLGKVQKWEHDPAGSGPGTIALTKEWETCGTPSCATGRIVGSPWAAAGNLYLQRQGTGGHLALSVADGSKVWGSGSGAHQGYAGVATGDLDKDGVREVVFATHQGVVVARDHRSGAVRWATDIAAALQVVPGAVAMSPTLADLDGDGKLEVLVAMQDAHGDDDRLHRARYVALNHDGAVQWSQRVHRGNPESMARAATLDLDGDGRLDILWRDWPTNGTGEGHDRLVASRVFALRGHDGKGLWSWGVHSRWGDQHLVIADVDGDGKQEVVIPEQFGARDGLAVYSVRGDLEAWWAAPAGWTVHRGAVAVPFEGTMHLVVALAKPSKEDGVRSPAGTSTTGQLLLLDTGKPYKAVHSNQHIYAG
jgi:hypothetical protein